MRSEPQNMVFALRTHGEGVTPSLVSSQCENHILWFAPHTFIFPSNMSYGYMSRQKDI